jgi:hypothetical protein
MKVSDLKYAVIVSTVVTLLLWVSEARTSAKESGHPEGPRIVQKNGRYALLVDGRPYLVLGGQIHNSSAWPSELPQVWKSLAGLHANTLVAPVYWEQLEPREGQFIFSNVDQLIEGARAHDLNVVLLWFGTWKNGNMHYVPSWVKVAHERFPRIFRPDGEPIDVLSPLGRNTLDAEKRAFVALMRHLKQVDGEQHTVLMIQVENEAGNIGSIRDNSAEANQLFEGQVPADLLAIAHKSPGSWKQVFGGSADEVFQLYFQAKFINQIAAAGKAEFAIPYYVNVWLDYPAGQLAQRQLSEPGIGYPSGGAVQSKVGLWRALAPSIDAIGPDIYSSNPAFVHSVIEAYRRPDNPLLIPEIGRSDDYGKIFYESIGAGAIGFTAFGVDETGWNITGDTPWKEHGINFALFKPMAREVAQLSLEGRIKTAIEQPGQATQEIDFGDWQATVSFGFPQRDGTAAPGTQDAHGAAMIAQLDQDKFLVTGRDVSVIFHLTGKKPWIHSQFLTVEQGSYANGSWKLDRLWNGDETDRGLCFYRDPELVQVSMERF